MSGCYNVTVNFQGGIMLQLDGLGPDAAASQAIRFLEEHLQCYAVDTRDVKVLAVCDVELEVFEVESEEVEV